MTLVITTCNLVEGDRVKCEKFWPEVQKGFKFLSITVEGISTEVLSKHLILRRFRVNDPYSGRVNMEVKQLHYTAWPDHGVPNGEAMEAFGQMIEISITHLLENDNSQKTVVHCSAGIGRTGTTITIIHAIINTWA